MSSAGTAGFLPGVASLGGIARRVTRLRGWRRAATAFIAGVISMLAMPPFFLWPVLLGTLPVLVWLIDGADDDAAAVKRRFLDRKRLLDAGIAGWWFGYGFHVAGLYWLREAFLVTGGGLAWLWPLGVLGLPAYLAVYYGLAAAFAAAVSRPGMGRVIAVAVGLGIAEWLRGHLFTGFPWNVLGMSLTGPLVLMQSVGVLGIYGLTVVATAATAAPAVLLAGTSARHGAGSRFRCLSLALAVLVVPLGLMTAYGAYRLSGEPPAFVEGVRLRLVQPSIPQREKWLPEKQPEFVERQLALSLRDPQGRIDNLAGITHVVWPEAAMPYLPLQRPQVLAAIGEVLPDGVHLLAGILRLEREQVGGDPSGGGAREVIRVFNSLAVFGDDGQPIGVYDKTHLVPFGEYLPFPEVLEAIGLQSLTRQRGGFTIGTTPRPILDVPGMPGVGPLICYEAVFPGVSRASATRPQALINVTNDGWFGNSTGPRQHLHQSRLRSVEEGLPLIRVANNGITAIYDAFGRELSRLELDIAGVIDTGLPGSTEPPPYARLGELTFWLLIGTGICGLWLCRND